MSDLVTGQALAPSALYRMLQERFRLLGQQGLVGLATSNLSYFPSLLPRDDQVDALGLIGQLLDHMNAPIRPEKKLSAVPQRRDWFNDDLDEEKLGDRMKVEAGARQ